MPGILGFSEASPQLCDTKRSRPNHSHRLRCRVGARDTHDVNGGNYRIAITPDGSKHCLRRYLTRQTIVNLNYIYIYILYVYIYIYTPQTLPKKVLGSLDLRLESPIKADCKVMLRNLRNLYLSLTAFRQDPVQRLP